MPTLYVENVPDELYEALRARARARNHSIAAEVIGMLREQVPTAADLERRRQFLKLARKMTAQVPAKKTARPVPTEDIVREDRAR
jgi:plasmid stability protein